MGDKVTLTGLEAGKNNITRPGLFINQIGNQFVVSEYGDMAGEALKVFDELGVASGYDGLLCFLQRYFSGKVTH